MAKYVVIAGAKVRLVDLVTEDEATEFVAAGATAQGSVLRYTLRTRKRPRSEYVGQAKEQKEERNAKWVK